MFGFQHFNVGLSTIALLLVSAVSGSINEYSTTGPSSGQLTEPHFVTYIEQLNGETVAKEDKNDAKLSTIIEMLELGFESVKNRVDKLETSVKQIRTILEHKLENDMSNSIIHHYNSIKQTKQLIKDIDAKLTKQIFGDERKW